MEKGMYRVFQLDDNIWQIEEGIDATFQVNSFLIAGKEKAMLIDCGFGKGNLKEVVEGLTSLPVDLVISHADGDHIYGHKAFGKAYMHPAEYDRYHRTVGADAPVAPLWEGDVIDLGGQSFEVILIPGHTPGSIALLDPVKRFIFCGDSVQGGLIFMAGDGRNITGYIESMKKLKAMSDRFDKIYASHGKPDTDVAILDDLIKGAHMVKDGEVKGEPMPNPIGGIEALVYAVGGVKFLY